MRYCPGSGQELLSALGVMEVCQDSRNFLMRKFPLSMIDALLKSMTCSILAPFAAVFTFLVCSFSLVAKDLPVSPM